MLERLCFMLTTELSDAGGPARPHGELAWPARVRSSDLVERSRCAAGGIEAVFSLAPI